MPIETRHMVRRRFIQMTGTFACSVLAPGCCNRQAETSENRPPPTSSDSPADRLLHASQPYIDVVVRPVVQPLKQVSDSTCWAAVWTMMLSWKEGKTLSMEEAVSRLGPAWIDHFRKNEGMAAQTFTEEGFLTASGLQAEPPANYRSSFYVERMASHGPLWINTGDGILNHATLVVGAQTRKDGRIDFRFADPLNGTYITKSDEQFFAEFEREARVIVDRKLNWDFRFQIFYW